MSLTHAFINPKSDGADATKARPSDWNADHVIDSDGLLLPSRTSDPGATAADKCRLYTRTIAGKSLLKFIGPNGLSMPIQPSLWTAHVSRWNAIGNVSTTAPFDGLPAMTIVGTETARTVNTTNLFTRMRRRGYVSAAGAGSLAGPRVASSQWTLGAPGTPNLGGFFHVVIFGCSDAATVAGARQFVGMMSSTSALTNVEPSTFTNVIGVGHGTADTNLKLYYGGSAAQTPIDLGANFPANTLSVDMYELVLYAPPDSNNTVYYRVTRLNTGHVAEGTLTGTAGTVLPANTTLLTNHQTFRCNNATALAVGLDVALIHTETDF